MYSGEYYLDKVDLRIRGRGFDFVWARHYRSREVRDSAMGKQWDFSYNIKVRGVDASDPNLPYDPNDPNGILLYDGHSRIDLYRQTGTDLWVSYALARELARNPADGTWTLTFPRRTTWHFAALDASPAQGKVSQIWDANGNAMSFTYDASGKLTTITDTLGRTITVGYDSDGFIASVTDFTGRVVSYAHYQDSDAEGSYGDVKSVTYPPVTGTPNGNDFPNGKTWTYIYTKNMPHERLNHNLLVLKDAKGQAYLGNLYSSQTDPSNSRFDRVIAQQYGNRTFEYVRAVVDDVPEYGYATMKTIARDRAGNVTEYYYNEKSELVMRLDFTGRADPNIFTSNTYNRPTNPLRGTDDPPYFVTRYYYNEDSRLIGKVYPGGNEVQAAYDASPGSVLGRGNKTQITWIPGPRRGDQNRIVHAYAYHATFNRVATWTDARAKITSYTYDASNGNLLRIDRPTVTTGVLGGGSQPVAVQFQYNQYGQLVHKINPTGRDDQFTYDTSGYLSQRIIDSGGLALTTTYGHDAVGNITSITDPRGNTEQFVRNQLNQVVRHIAKSPLNYQTDYYYDADDKIIKVDVQNVDDQGQIASNAYLTTIYEYDLLDRLIRRTQEVDGSRNVMTEYQYDDATAGGDPNGNGRLTLIKFGEATSGHQPSNVLRYRYDERDLLFEVVRGENDLSQSTTRYDYDLSKSLVRIRQGLESSARLWTFATDGYNRRTGWTDPNGNVSSFHYDANGNRVSARVDGELIQGESGSNVRLAEETLTCDEINRAVRRDIAFFDTQTGNPIGDGVATTRWFYNAASNAIRCENDNGNGLNLAYDTANRLHVVTDGKGNSRTFARDGNGNPTTITDADWSDYFQSSSNFTRTNVYDALNRLTDTTDSGSNHQHLGYDSLSNLTLRLDTRGNRTSYAYDGLRRLIQTTRVLTDNGTGSGNPIGTITTTQTWDDTSRVTARTDPNGHATTYVYDALNRLSRIQYANGTTEQASYDVHHNRTSTLDGNQTSVSNQYDMLNRLVSRSISRAPGVLGTTSETYKYDGLGRVVYAQNSDPNGTISTETFAYDSLGHAVSRTLNGQTVTAVHDGVGNETSVSYPGGRTVASSYDELNRKHVISSNQGGTLAQLYYVGPWRQEGAVLGNNVLFGMAFDSARRPYVIEHVLDPNGTNTPIDLRIVQWDASSNKIQRVNVLQGGLTHNLTYDSVDRMVSSTLSTTPPTAISYALDGVGNRTLVTGGQNPGAYTMDPNNPPGDAQMNQYTTTAMDARTYDQNGNLKQISGANPPAGTFAYDYRNRMVEFTDSLANKQHSYAYDCFGRLIKKVGDVAGTPLETRYFYDGWRAVEEQDGTGTTQATYVHGDYIDEVITMRRLGNDYYYIGDDHYNVMGITDAAGNVIERYDYGDFGQPVDPVTRQPITSSAVGNPFFFTGRRFDWQTRFYDYRTRYYDPVAGRFVSRDSIGVWGDRKNLGNAFGYVGNNPWSRRDPLGRCPSDPTTPSTPAPGDPSEPTSWSDWADSLVSDAWSGIFSDDDLANLSDAEIVAISVGISVAVGVTIGVGIEIGLPELIGVIGSGDDEGGAEPPDNGTIPIGPVPPTPPPPPFNEKWPGYEPGGDRLRPGDELPYIIPPGYPPRFGVN